MSLNISVNRTTLWSEPNALIFAWENRTRLSIYWTW
jgi:hypothetical protein